MDLKIIVPNTDFINMKKYLIIALFFCLTAGVSILLFITVVPRIFNAGTDDVIRLEDSIIVHGIQMESDTPLTDGGDETGGRIIFDESFDDALAGGDGEKKLTDTAADVKADMKEFNSMRAKDPRWHLCIYKIKRTDNLWRIARKYGLDHRLIINVNGINNPDMLEPGKFINVPSLRGVYYKVKKGDTISAIAGRYRISTGKIIAHNQLKGGHIRQGQKIFLPDARELVVRQAAVPSRIKEIAALAADLNGFIWPLQGKITSGFGNRTDPLSGHRRFHCGIDISADAGTPIRAVSEGRVIFSGWKPGYGNVVIVRHKGGYVSVYAHNSKNLVDTDVTVSRGDTIAYSGMTGAVTGAHLHFELRKYITPLNPMRFLR